MNLHVRVFASLAVLVLLVPCTTTSANEPQPTVAEKSPARIIPAHPKADITGIVFDNRQPVGGVIVQAWYMGWMGSGWRELTTEEAVTDQNGRFAITMLRHRLSGLKIIARTDDWHRMGVFEIDPSSDPEEASERHRLADPVRLKDLEVRLAPAVSQVIQVVDVNAKPVAGANVGTFLMGSWHFGKSKTDQDGNAELWLPASMSSAEVFAWKPGLGLDYAISRFADPQNDPLKLTLKSTATVRIQVLDAVTNEPLPNVKLTIPIPRKAGLRGGYAGPHYGFGISHVTDKTGTAKIDWLPDWMGRETVEVWGWHSGYQTPGAKLDSRQRRQLTLKMSPMFRLRGRVFHPDGTPAKGIVVESANGRNISFRDRSVTDQNGQYELAARSDLKCVVVVLDQKWGAEPQTQFTIEEPGRSAKVPDMRLSPAKRVHGVLRAEEGKTPVPGEQIWLHVYSPPVGDGKLPSRNIDRKAPFATLTTWTDKNGRYEFHVGPCAFDIQAPKDFESVDGVFITRGYSHWQRNLPVKQNSMEYDFLRPIWTEMP